MCETEGGRALLLTGWIAFGAWGVSLRLSRGEADCYLALPQVLTPGPVVLLPSLRDIDRNRDGRRGWRGRWFRRRRWRRGRLRSRLWGGYWRCGRSWRGSRGWSWRRSSINAGFISGIVSVSKSKHVPYLGRSLVSFLVPVATPDCVIGGALLPRCLPDLITFIMTIVISIVVAFIVAFIMPGGVPVLIPFVTCAGPYLGYIILGIPTG